MLAGENGATGAIDAMEEGCLEKGGAICMIGGGGKGKGRGGEML